MQPVGEITFFFFMEPPPSHDIDHSNLIRPSKTFCNFLYVYVHTPTHKYLYVYLFENKLNTLRLCTIQVIKVKTVLAQTAPLSVTLYILFTVGKSLSLDNDFLISPCLMGLRFYSPYKCFLSAEWPG